MGGGISLDLSLKGVTTLKRLGTTVLDCKLDLQSMFPYADVNLKWRNEQGEPLL